MTLFENTMKAPFRVPEAHEEFIVDWRMTKGIGSTVVDHFTFGVRNNINKVKKVMNRWSRARRVKINGGKRFRGAEM